MDWPLIVGAGRNARGFDERVVPRCVASSSPVCVNPSTLCRYEFTTRNQHVVMAVSSKFGKVYMAAGATDEATFPRAEQQLRSAVDSFQLIL